MRIAARWFGWGSLVAALATTAALTAQHTRTAHPLIAAEQGDSLFYEVSVSGHDDERAVQGCFDLHSALVSIDRDDDQRAVVVRVEAGGPLETCIANHTKRRSARFVSPPPSSVYFHDRTDPWAPTTEGELFPPKIYRCTGISAQHVISIPEIQPIRRAAEPCLGTNDVEYIDTDLADDGSIRGMTFETTDSAQRAECLRRAVCQYRFTRDAAGVAFVPILVAGPSARLKIAPVLKHPYE